MTKNSEYLKKWRNAKRARGECIYCRRPIAPPSSCMCEAHADARRAQYVPLTERKNNRRPPWVEGMCEECHSAPLAVRSVSSCEACLAKFREKYRSKRKNVKTYRRKSA